MLAIPWANNNIINRRKRHIHYPIPEPVRNQSPHVTVDPIVKQAWNGTYIMVCPRVCYYKIPYELECLAPITKNCHVEITFSRANPGPFYGDCIFHVINIASLLPTNYFFYCINYVQDNS